MPPQNIQRVFFFIKNPLMQQNKTSLTAWKDYIVPWPAKHRSKPLDSSKERCNVITRGLKIRRKLLSESIRAAVVNWNKLGSAHCWFYCIFERSLGKTTKPGFFSPLNNKKQKIQEDSTSVTDINRISSLLKMRHFGLYCLSQLIATLCWLQSPTWYAAC